jgi:hypothetical protein
MTTNHPHGRHSSDHTHRKQPSNHPHAGQSSNHAHGQLSLAPDANAPLLIVFGGIDVGPDKNHKVRSGIYMWNYMGAIKDKFHIFVAYNHRVKGAECYHLLTKALEARDVTPSRQILYLFSGGYYPGRELLTGNGPTLFSSIYLVDIWMGSSTPSDFYKKLANSDAAKLTYVYTNFGADNSAARDYVANRVGPRATLVSKGKAEYGAMTHMRTNAVAIGTLK